MTSSSFEMQPFRLKKWPRALIPLVFLFFIIWRILFLIKTDVVVKGKTPLTEQQETWLGDALEIARKYKLVNPQTVFASYKSDAETSKSKTIKVIVVEEHHEVIPYWFEAARKGIIPQTGNVLIHIDGHTDVVLPQYDPEMPFFNWPETQEQVHHMVQSNDDFIMNAVITGLITRLVLVTPSWDKSNNITEFASPVGIGTVVPNTYGEPLFCACFVNPSEGVLTCRGQDKENRRETVTIKVHNCKVRLRIDGRQAVDHAALNILKTSRSWVGASKNIILDIDEDYFGVELAAQNLHNAGFNWTIAEQLQVSLTSTFCPKNISHEGLGNAFVRELIRIILRHCSASFRSADGVCHRSTSETSRVVRAFALSYWRRDRQLFCTHSVVQLLGNLDEMSSVLYQFKLRDLYLLKEFGFCLSTTPASNEFRQPGGARLVLCVGVNTPQYNVVYLHKPLANEIRARAWRLRKILYLIGVYHQPSLVTVCRSVRDGYTPRSSFRTIETSILDIFEDLPGHYDVEYDENLYGGRGGWPDRHNVEFRTKWP